MPTTRHNIRFPSIDTNELSQNEAYFTLTDAAGVELRIRFHDYGAIYARRGLYEQLFYDRLKCQSPEKVVAILRHAMAGESRLIHELRVLDLGAGNGMVGAELQRFGVARLVGTETEAIVSACDQLLTNPSAYSAMASQVSPYGDGQAARRICDALAYVCGRRRQPPDEFQFDDSCPQTQLADPAAGIE